MSTASDTSDVATVQEPQARGRLYRSDRQRVIAGVCGGLGEYFAADPVWFRIGFVVLAVGGGSGILLYLLMWLFVPRQPDGYVPGAAASGTKSGIAVIGVVLMGVGAIALINTAVPWMGQYFWPVIFVVGGLALIAGGLNRDSHR